MSSPRIVAHLPSSYPHQEGLTCGETNVRTIVDAFGKPFRDLDPPPFRTKLVGYAFIRDIQRLFEHNGLVAPISHATRRSDAERIATLCACIDRDEPAMLAIGNGHVRRDRYVRRLRYVVGHFITIYGYDADDRAFFVHDPYLTGPAPVGLPAGNEVRSFETLLWDWRGPVYYPLIGMDHIYLPARAPNE